MDRHMVFIQARSLPTHFTFSSLLYVPRCAALADPIFATSLAPACLALQLLLQGSAPPYSNSVGGVIPFFWSSSA